MDADGAFAFLRRVATPNDWPALPDREVDPLSGQGIRNRIQLFREGLRGQNQLSTLVTSPPPTYQSEPIGAFHFTRRLGTPDDWARITTRAKSVTPPGAGLYARYLAACMLRTQHQLFQRQGWKTPYYATSFPMRISTVGSNRPVHGNYIVSPILYVSSDEVEDEALVGKAVLRQIEAYQAAQGDLQQCAVLWMLSRVRPWQYRAIMRSAVSRSPILTGFSYFQADAKLFFDQVLGVPIVGAHCGGVVAVPPGWNPVFCRHGDRISLTVAWTTGCPPDALAIEFADLIAQTVLSG
jgi:hypothetical protein